MALVPLVSFCALVLPAESLHVQNLGVAVLTADDLLATISGVSVPCPEREQFRREYGDLLHTLEEVVTALERAREGTCGNVWML